MTQEAKAMSDSFTVAWESRASHIPTRHLGRTEWSITAIGVLDTVDRCTVVAGCLDGAVHGWDWQTGDQVLHFPAPPNFVPKVSGNKLTEVRHTCALQMRDGKGLVVAALNALQLVAIDVATATVVGRFDLPESEESIRALCPYEHDGRQGVLLVSDVSTVRWLSAPDLELLHAFGQMTAEWMHGLSLARHGDQRVLVTWHERYGLGNRHQFVALRIWDLNTMRVLWSCNGLESEYGLVEATVCKTRDSFFVLGERLDTEAEKTLWFFRPDIGNGVPLPLKHFRNVVAVTPTARQDVYQIVARIGLSNLVHFAIDPGMSFEQVSKLNSARLPDFEGFLATEGSANVGRRGVLLKNYNRLLAADAHAILSACDTERQSSGGDENFAQWEDRDGPIMQIAANESFVMAGTNGDFRILSARDGTFVRRARTQSTSIALLSSGESWLRGASSWFVGLSRRQLTLGACASEAQEDFDLADGEDIVAQQVRVPASDTPEFVFVAGAQKGTGRAVVAACPIDWPSSGPTLRAPTWRWRDEQSNAGDGEVSLLAWREDGEMFLAIGTQDTRIVVIKAFTAEPVGLYKDPAPAGSLCRMCRVETVDGTRIAYLTDRGTLGLWNPRTDATAVRAQEDDQRELYQGLASVGGLGNPRVVTCSSSSTIRIRDLSLTTISSIGVSQHVKTLTEAGTTGFAVAAIDGVMFFKAAE